MGKTSRDKGARGEREFKNLALSHGIRAARRAQLQAGEQVDDAADVELLDHRRLHHEVKRDERMSVDAMVRQAVHDAAKTGRVPVVAYRRNREPWRINLPADLYFDLLKGTYEPRRPH